MSLVESKEEIKEEIKEEVSDDFPEFEFKDGIDDVEPMDPSSRPLLLQQHLWHMCERKELTDVAFVVGEGKNQRTFHAHKLVLASASPLFEAMLFPDPSFEDEKKSKSDDYLEVKIPNQDPEAFAALLKCIYTDEVDVDADNLSGLIAIASKYQIEKMRVACADFMERDINLENICQLFEIAPTLLGKPDFGYPFIREHSEEVFKSEGFLKLSKKRVQALLDDDKLTIEEFELFSAVVRWGEAEAKRTGKTKKEVLGDVITKIRFPIMAVNRIAGPVTQSGLLPPEDLLAVFQYVSVKDEKKKSTIVVPYSKKEREGKKNYLVQWDPTQSFTNGLYVVTNNGHTARKATSEGTIYILRATKLLEAKGVYYWEIHIDTLVATNDIQIGAAIATYSWTQAWLQGTGSYWIDRSGQCWEGTTSRFATGPLATGDRLGFLLDYKKNVLEFFRGRGKKGGKMTRIGAFTGVRAALYPVLAARPVGNQFTSV